MITNRLGLPEPLVAAVRADPYDSKGSDITVTTLLKPPRAVALEILHREEIVEDAGDRIWALVGQIGHMILERGSREELTEKRLFTEMAGWKISGQVDLVRPKGTEELILTDYKLTSSWSCKDGPKPDWTRQLNMLNLLASRNSVHVTRAQIVAIYRDWSKLEARRSRDYPQHQVQLFEIEIWPMAKTEAYMAGRVAAHQAARKSLPECTPDERWEKAPVWAVKKDGRVRAIKLHSAEASALGHAKALGAGHSVEFRPGERVRCANYCSAAPFCSSWKSWVEGGGA